MKSIALSLVLFAGVLGLLAYNLMSIPPKSKPPEIYYGGKSYPPTELKFIRKELGEKYPGFPLITNLQIMDLDKDGKNEILCCDARTHTVSQFSRNDTNEWIEKVIIEDVNTPAHATPVDIDKDGDLDLIISILGSITPEDGVVGRVELFEKTKEGYKRHIILDDVRRVADVQPADFDGDGDIDLAVAVFGYARGSVLWLENKGNFVFEDHHLLFSPGTIHVPVADYDGDGDLDIAACVTQEEEEIWIFENLGKGEFKNHMIWFTFNNDLGGAGLVQADLDKDGDPDLILPAGDNLEDLDAVPQPYHGCYWFENKGGLKFEEHRISDLGGTYAADVGDLDGDGDLDVVLVSMTNDWDVPGNSSVVWLENDGRQNFKSWEVDDFPIHLVTVAVGDLNGDGTNDIVAGALNMRKPFDRYGRVTAWFNQGGKK